MIENYSISQNKVGSLLVTLVLGMSIGDLQPEVKAWLKRQRKMEVK
jgi:hypothetical protein